MPLQSNLGYSIDLGNITQRRKKLYYIHLIENKTINRVAGRKQRYWYVIFTFRSIQKISEKKINKRIKMKRQLMLKRLLNILSNENSLCYIQFSFRHHLHMHSKHSPHYSQFVKETKKKTFFPSMLSVLITAPRLTALT